MSTDTIIERARPLAPLVLRVVLGGLFVYHGFDKFSGGINGVLAMFDGWGVPASSVAAPLVAVIEIVGGAALIVGVGTRIAAAALGAVMIGALLFVKVDLGLVSDGPMPGAELDLALLAGLVAIAVIGPGPFSVDARVRQPGGQYATQSA